MLGFLVIFMEVRAPLNENEFEEYYNLRWRVFRKPFGQNRGSEKDDLEDVSLHKIAIEEEKIVGVGRLHFDSEGGWIRYMAVDQNYRNGKGVGSMILKELEREIHDRKFIYGFLNSRDDAVGFYKKNNWEVVGEGSVLFGTLKHKLMKKEFNRKLNK
jgi:ribosomal protein S18 acetylase RimI-like enzyme